MEFEAYLREKKIDTVAFKASEPDLWVDFERIFLQMHPKSFTMQKLNLINNLRRKYHLVEEESQAKEVKKPSLKPKMKPAAAGAAKSTNPKPKMGKPNIKVKPQVNPSKDEPKPKMGKPKIGKPKITPKPKGEEKQEGEKPKTPKVKPVIKRPKIK